VINSCTSRQTVYAVGSGGVVKAHPEWPGTAGNKQNKKARNLSVSGPLHERAWKVCAYAQPPPGSTWSSTFPTRRLAAAFVEYTWLWCWFSRVDGMPPKPPHAQTRTSDRPEAGRMLVKVNAMFTMVPGSKIAAVGR